jgi:putative ABC transport system permease protein
MSRPSPPRVPRSLLRRLLPATAREEVLSDLDEIWAERCALSGRPSANRWYWRQLVASVVPFATKGWTVDQVKKSEEGMMESIRQDVAYAIKQLIQHPAVGLVVVLTLSLGIGATTAMFSAVHGVLLKGLPYVAADELVMVTTRAGGTSLPRYLSGPDFVELGASARTLSDVAGFLEPTVGPMTGVDRPEHVLTTPVTWNVFHLLGVEPALGRSFNAEDAVPVPPTTDPVPPVSAVISHAFWQRSFGGDPTVVGRVVDIWGGATEIVGVLPKDFRATVPPELNVPPSGDVWPAIRWDMTGWSREGRWLRTIARLAPGASLRRSQQEVDAFAERLRVVHPHHAAEATELRVTSLEAAVAARMSGTLWVLMGAVALVLLIACANVANLLLARGASRAGEMAVRSSLGAGSGRLVRQLLTESAVMAALGGVGGFVLAHAGVTLLQAIRPPELHRLAAVGVDGTVLVFSLIVAVAATLLSGLLPAWHGARAGAGAHLRTRGDLGGARRSRAALVVGEVSLSVVLLVGAGLLVRTFGELQRMPLGFEPERVLTVTATQPSRPRAERQTYEADLLRAAQSVPGVVSAGIVFPLPMNGVYERSAEYVLDGRQADPAAWTTAYFRTVSPTYFATMGLEMKRGRGFTEADENYDVPVVILDEHLAQREFSGRDPVGQPLWVRGMEGDTLRAEIVGVVEYAPQWDHRDTRPTMYFPRIFYQSHEVSVVAKMAEGAWAAGARLSDAIRSVDPAFPADLVPMEAYVHDRLARSRFLLILMQTFGGLALALSAIGLYSVLSYSVRQRTREIGLRLALGAERPAVTGDVVWTGVRLAAGGIGLGLLGALAMGHALRAQLFRVHAADPWTLAAATVLVIAVAVAASVIPAVRAAGVDPVVALREE